MARTAHVIAGLGWGDEGKGHLVDHLVRETGAHLVVKYTGGPQATHTVVLSDGREHRFSQFGSGTFAGADTFIDREVLVEPYAMMNETKVLKFSGVDDPLLGVTIHPECLIITPMHWLLNRLREQLRGDQRHGSCGMGIGEARSMVAKYCLGLRVKDIYEVSTAATGRNVAHRKARAVHLIKAIWHLSMHLGTSLTDGEVPPALVDFAARMQGERLNGLLDAYVDWIRSVGRIAPSPDALARGGDVVFEGSQGVLLDHYHGFRPYCTHATTTFANGVYTASEWGLSIRNIGVLRAYSTRHGAGPFPTEDQSVQWEDHNSAGPWQGNFRQGHFDFVLANHAIKSCGNVDALAITHLDRAHSTAPFKYCDEYAFGEERAHRAPAGNTAAMMRARPIYSLGVVGHVGHFISERLGVPLAYESRGPKETDIRSVAVDAVS